MYNYWSTSFLIFYPLVFLFILVIGLGIFVGILALMSTVVLVIYASLKPFFKKHLAVTGSRACR
jgi:hypothetical protein